MSVSEPDLSETEVFADRLQARGDPRGELLGLELAAERAQSSAEARRLNREAQRIRNAHRSLVWPEALADSNVSTRAGFVVAAAYEELFASGVPLELALSVRDLRVGSATRLEDCLATLIPARMRGLRLDSLRQPDVQVGPPTNLAGFRQLAAVPAAGHALELIEIPWRVVDVAALASLSGLRECLFGDSRSQAELCSLATSKLERLGLEAPLDPVIVPLFGNTLAALEFRYDRPESLEPLAGLPWLRELLLHGPAPTPEMADDLAHLLRLERLRLSDLREPDLVVALRSQPLRSLTVESLDATLVAGLLRLRSLEHLHIAQMTGGPLDLASLAELPKLRSLSLPPEFTGGGVLPPGCETLHIRDARERLAIAGNVVELCASNCDPRCLPPAMLAGIRRLTLRWPRATFDDFLAELPRACPELERLTIEHADDDREWHWDDAPAILDALPRLRSFVLSPTDNAELTEIARAFPELCPLRTDSWPRSAGETPRVSVTTRREPAVTDEEHPFARLRSWAAELRASKDPRGELLELELAAELTDDPTEARALEREATHLRGLVWPTALRHDRALLRAGMPIVTSGEWLNSTSAPPELLASLRAVEIEHTSLDTCLRSLAQGRAHGLRLERLALLESLNTEFSSYGVLQSLRGFDELDTLSLQAKIQRSQRHLLPELRLRHLSLSSGNFDRIFVGKFAAMLDTFELGPNLPRIPIGSLEFPRLRALALGQGWDVEWALRQRGLRELSLDTYAIEPLDQLAHMRLETLKLQSVPAAMQHVLRLSGLRRLEFISRVNIEAPFEFTGDASLEHLGLGWQHQPPPAIELNLPEPLASLALHGNYAPVTVDGSFATLDCSWLFLAVQPQLCTGVRRLVLRAPDGAALPDHLSEHAAMLEHFELHAQDLAPADAALLLHGLAALPRLRTVTLHGCPLGAIAELSEQFPILQLHGVDPGWRDPSCWPLPPE
jgi:hypothetical protein